MTEAIVKSCINTAFIYSSEYMDFAEAYSYLQKAENICLDNHLDTLLATVQHSLAVLHNSSENTRQGRLVRADSHNLSDSLYLRTFETAKRVGLYNIMAYSLFNYISDGVNESDSAAIIKFARSYLSSPIPDSEPTKEYTTNMCHGLLKFFNGEYNEAIEYYDSMIPNGFPFQRDSVRMAEQRDILIAKTFEALGNREKSQQILSRLLQTATQRNNLGAQLSLNYELYRLNLNINDAASRQYLLQYYDIREKMVSKGGAESSITEIELKQTVRDYEKSLKIASVKERHSQIVIVCISIAALSVIIILLLCLYFSRKRRHYIMALYEKNISVAKDQNTSYEFTPDDEEELPDTIIKEELPDNKTDTKTIVKNDAELIEKIVDVLSHDESVFDPDYQMARLCAQVGSNATYVSRAINAHYGKSFKSVLTERRIREACRRLDNPDYNSTLTIEAICLSVGFKSRTAFATAFRNITGLTPSEYRQAARKYMPK